MRSCRSKHTDRQRPTRRFQTVGLARGHHQGPSGEVAGRDRRSAPAAATARAASPRGSSAAAHKQAYRVIDFKRDKTRHSGDGGGDRVRSEPLGAHRAAELRGRREALHPPARRAEGGQKVMSGPEGRHPGGQRAAAEEHPRRHHGAQHRAEAGQGRADGALGRHRRRSWSRSEGDLALLKLPSGEIRRVPVDCMATIGQVGNLDHENVSLGKAGRTRWLGKTPAQPRRLDEPGGSPARRRRGQDLAAAGTR